MLTFLTFAIGKFETFLFQNCPNKTKILWSNFEITNSESESQQSALQLNEIELLYQENFIKLGKLSPEL
jgi:hypothetical protein